MTIENDKKENDEEVVEECCVEKKSTIDTCDSVGIIFDDDKLEGHVEQRNNPKNNGHLLNKMSHQNKVIRVIDQLEVQSKKSVEQ